MLHTAKKAAFRDVLAEEAGQSTLEYAAILWAFLSVCLAIGALWKLGAQGQLQELAAGACSHITGALGGFRDIVLF